MRASHIVLVYPLWLGAMPAPLLRWYYRAHSLKALRRNKPGFVGIAPVAATVVGGAADMPAERCARWCARLERLGVRASRARAATVQR